MRLNVLGLFTAPRGSATLRSPSSGKVELLWRGISEGKQHFKLWKLPWSFSKEEVVWKSPFLLCEGCRCDYF